MCEACIDDSVLRGRAHAVMRMAHLEHTAPVCTCDHVFAEFRSYADQVYAALGQRDAANVSREEASRAKDRACEIAAVTHGHNVKLKADRDADRAALAAIRRRLREAERLALIHAHRTGWTSAFELYDAIHALCEAP